MPQEALKILLVSASKMEMLEIEYSYCDKLVTGVGMVATTFAVTRALQSNNYDLVIDMGIAGSFQQDLKLGDVVQVISDRISELGVENRESFVPANEMKLVSADELFFETNERIPGLPTAFGITVNRVHGEASSILKVKMQFSPDVESMEGAAVAYVCQQLGVNWVQIRAISNRVEPRNRDAWNIPLAIEKLHKEVRKYIEDLVDEK